MNYKEFMGHIKHSPCKESTQVPITWVELGFGADGAILAVFCSKEAEGIFWAGRATGI